MSIMNNKNNKGLKNSSIYTTNIISKNIYNILKDVKKDIILEPSIGKGNMINQYKNSKIIGVDINPIGEKYCDTFYNCKFEDLELEKIDCDIVICNPPFNGHKSRKLYPEVFLKKIVELCGKDIQIVMITPHGLRLNQKIKSSRWKWIKNNLEITSILSLPLDIFPNVLFHSEVLFFNINNIKPHYFLDF